MENWLPVLLVPVHLGEVAVAVSGSLGQLDGAIAVQWSHQSILDRLVASKVVGWLYCELVDLVCPICVFLSGQDGTFSVQIGVPLLSSKVHCEEYYNQDQEDGSYCNADSHAGFGTC